MLKACHIVECNLFDEKEDSNCKKFGDIEDCAINFLYNLEVDDEEDAGICVSDTNSD